ncbi:MAG: hypothetical protein IPP17_29065 [Bacteroidetes bacterium]|nr:hypothetical protein [Bacteroidota bacterium]
MEPIEMTPFEAIRRRPGMYVGELSHRGLKNLLGYLLDDLLQFSTEKITVRITFLPDHQVQIVAEDILISPILDCWKNMGDPKRYFQNLGIPVLIALSEQVQMVISTQNHKAELVSRKGVYELSAAETMQGIGQLSISFNIDPDIFQNVQLGREMYGSFLQNYAYIETRLKIVLHDLTTGEPQIIQMDYPSGLSQLMDRKLSEQLHGKTLFRLDLEETIGAYSYKICIAYLDCWLSKTEIVTYANFDELIYGGSLINGIRKGLSKALGKYATLKGIAIDNRKIRNQLTVVAAVKGSKFDWVNATRTNLDVPAIAKDSAKMVEAAVFQQLLADEGVAAKVLEIFEPDV